MTGTLIVGGGQAGAQIAAGLRDHGYDRPVTLVGSEHIPPYQRPPLSKDYLLGKLPAAKLALRNEQYYARKDIDVVTGTSVTEAGIGDDGGWARTADGRRFTFEYLALATGAQPRRLPGDMGSPGNLLYLRTVADADRLRSLLDTATRFVVIGGGFIGLEAAAVLRAHGKQVTVVEMADRLLNRVAGSELGDFYLDAHRRRGVGFRLGRSVTALTTGATGDAVGVVLDGGETLACDAVVAGVGVVRDPRLAEQLGLAWDNGVIVDRYARTSHPRVVAAGDCVLGPHPAATGRIRLESVQNAVAQAKVAAATICGRTEPYTAVPWFWSNQGTLRLQTAGLHAGATRRILRGDPRTENFSVIYLRENTLTAVEAMNRPADFATARTLLAAGAELVGPATAVADPDIPLADALAVPATTT
ncbi:FAD-dependent oxidoreductase [Nocardia sp. NPDC050799]|uniref:NAD(P)/FAD-dependent oxidoreductase n=1 Tax=Nocardia sp. NPDC050799 TaxID=3154842 RepID=UPI0033E7A5BA